MTDSWLTLLLFGNHYFNASPRLRVQCGWLTWHENFEIIENKRWHYHILGIYRWISSKPRTFYTDFKLYTRWKVNVQQHNPTLFLHKKDIYIRDRKKYQPKQRR